MQQTEILSIHWLIFQLVYVIILLLLSYCVSSLKKTKKNSSQPKPLLLFSELYLIIQKSERLGTISERMLTTSHWNWLLFGKLKGFIGLDRLYFLTNVKHILIKLLWRKEGMRWGDGQQLCTSKRIKCRHLNFMWKWLTCFWPATINCITKHYQTLHVDHTALLSYHNGYNEQNTSTLLSCQKDKETGHFIIYVCC